MHTNPRLLVFVEAHSVAYGARYDCAAMGISQMAAAIIRVSAHRESGWTSYDPDAAAPSSGGTLSLALMCLRGAGTIGTAGQVQCRRVRSGQSLKDFDREK